MAEFEYKYVKNLFNRAKMYMLKRQSLQNEVKIIGLCCIYKISILLTHCRICSFFLEFSNNLVMIPEIVEF